MTFDIEASDTSGKLWKYSVTVTNEDGQRVARYSNMGITKLRQMIRQHQKGQMTLTEKGN